MQTIIQHHRTRSRHLAILKYLLGNSNRFIEVVEDNNNSASGMRKCFELGINLGADNLLILQDDIITCKNILLTAKQLPQLLPNKIISLFSAYNVVSTALRTNRHWATIDRLYGLCAYIIPTFMAKEYLEYEKNIKDSIIADDVRLSMYLASKNQLVYLTAPSLVEHICWHTSTNNKIKDEVIDKENGIRHRISDRFIGVENDSEKINWTLGLTNPAHLTIGQKFDFVRHLKPCTQN